MPSSDERTSDPLTGDIYDATRVVGLIPQENNGYHWLMMEVDAEVFTHAFHHVEQDAWGSDCSYCIEDKKAADDYLARPENRKIWDERVPYALAVSPAAVCQHDWAHPQGRELGDLYEPQSPSPAHEGCCRLCGPVEFIGPLNEYQTKWRDERVSASQAY